MYNLQFDAAHRTFADWIAQHPADPLGPASNAAAYLFSELDRLRILEAEFFVDDDKFTGNRGAPDPKVKAAFTAELSHAARLSGDALAKNPEDPQALFASVMQRGLEADYLSLIERSNLAALKETMEARNLADKLLAIRPDYYDAHVAVGVENYLLSLKPAPLRWLLRLGGAQADREEGISRLRLVAEKGTYLMPFARLLLAVAALRDRNTQAAKGYLQWLVREFPGNRLYRQELAKLP